MRLTVLYGGLFLMAGTLLLGLTYLLVAQSLDHRTAAEPDIGSSFASGASPLTMNSEQFAETIRQFRSERQEFRDETMRSLLTQGGIALLGVGSSAVAIGWLIAGRALRPLYRITETAQRIAGADGAGRGLHERIALPGPRDEIKELADTFDLMVERLDRSFDGQRRFVANASHELRTPLALNRALVELAVTRPAATAETRQLGESLLAVNERHERLIDGLLMLADAENEIAERTTVDLADIVEHVLDQNVPPGRTAVRDLRPAVTSGDPILLERLTQNLVENAVRHNTGEGWLSVSTGVSGDLVVLTVANTGPVVPAYEVESLFQPFRRLHRERIDGGRGFGLGLSIVRAVARAHGGDAQAQVRPGGGLTVTVTLAANPSRRRPSGLP